MDNIKKITKMLHVSKPSYEDCHADPIAMTAAYNFDSTNLASRMFNNRIEGNIYSRFTNPTVRIFEKKVAELELAEDAIAFSSGMSAYLALAVCFLQQGDHVLIANGIFGTTTSLFKNYLAKFGVNISTFELTDKLKISLHLKNNTKMIIIESPTNPLFKVADIRKISDSIKGLEIIFVVDNTLLTPIFQKPILLGATLSLHSGGKFFDGQGRCVAGIIAGGKKHINLLKTYLRHSGTCLSPFNAWLLSTSIDTLLIRMLFYKNTLKNIYKYLTGNQYVDKVYSTLSQSHDGIDVIKKQQSGHSPMISFEIKGTQEDAWKFIDNLQLIKNCTNIGGAISMVTHPATTTHCKYSEEDLIKTGIKKNLIRLCLGFENTEDLIEDLNQAFNKTF